MFLFPAMGLVAQLVLLFRVRRLLHQPDQEGPSPDPRPAGGRPAQGSPDVNQKLVNYSSHVVSIAVALAGLVPASVAGICAGL